MCTRTFFGGIKMGKKISKRTTSWMVKKKDNKKVIGAEFEGKLYLERHSRRRFE